MQRVQETALQPTGNDISAKATLQQLPPRHDAILGLGEGSDLPIPETVGRSSAHTAHK